MGYFIDKIKQNIAKAQEKAQEMGGKEFAYFNEFDKTVHTVPKRLFPGVKILNDVIRDRELEKIEAYYFPKIEKLQIAIEKLEHAQGGQMGIIEDAYVFDEWNATRSDKVINIR